MGHNVSDYSQLWCYVGELEKEKAASDTTKSSLKAEVTCLKEMVAEERKKWEDHEKELNNAPIEAHHELSHTKSLTRHYSLQEHGGLQSLEGVNSS